MQNYENTHFRTAQIHRFICYDFFGKFWSIKAIEKYKKESFIMTYKKSDQMGNSN